MKENTISGKVIGAAIEVHKQLGPGLLEKTYQHCLFHELRRRGISVRKEVPLPVVYKGEKLDLGYRIDLLVGDKVIVEVKAVEALAPIHTAQVLTYLKLKEKKLGLLINFNTLLLKNGIQRVLNGYIQPSELKD
ncbi:MAG: GxxExxY protein [Saprospirales bacterium]|nr:MAG: GxxExxY protein [Saprospirales bacterium]